MKLSRINPVLNEITQQIENSLADSLKQGFIVDTTAIAVAVDITQVNIQPAKFTIERRAGSPYFENIYFSSAPLRTVLHLELVEKFEKSIL
jgi:hypothetical protein